MTECLSIKIQFYVKPPLSKTLKFNSTVIKLLKVIVCCGSIFSQSLFLGPALKGHQFSAMGKLQQASQALSCSTVAFYMANQNGI